jgi:hypothetical protein
LIDCDILKLSRGKQQLSSSKSDVTLAKRQLPWPRSRARA